MSRYDEQSSIATSAFTDAVRVLADFAVGKVSHLYLGSCPDPIEGSAVRDDRCPVCAALRTIERNVEHATTVQREQPSAAPCGDDKTHMHWKDRGWRCPACAAVSEKARREQPSAASVAVPDVDELANFIRIIDGNHRMGAGALAEQIVEWIAAAPHEKAAQSLSTGAKAQPDDSAKPIHTGRYPGPRLIVGDPDDSAASVEGRSDG